MSLFSLFKKKKTDEQKETLELTGAETVHDSGLTDHESAESQGNAEFKNEALKDKGKSPYKPVR